MTDVNGISSERLRSIIERIERMNEEKKAIAEDIKDIYAEAKGVGYDTKILRAVIRLRAMDQAEREEQQELIDTYMSALGVA